MARKAREISKSGNYYITLKGNELFVTDEDKKMFVEILEKNFATGIVHSYYLTKSEIRLVVKEGEKGISMTMKPVTTSYARYFNRTHEREGKLFADRFKSEPLETDEEIEECIKNLENDTPKKQAKPKRTAPKKKDVTKVKKIEIKIEKTEETKPIEEKKEEKKVSTSEKLVALQIAKEMGGFDIMITLNEEKYISALTKRAEMILKWASLDLLV